MDEATHVQIFKYIYRTTVKESFNGVIPEVIVQRAIKLIKEMTEAEIRWGKYVSKGLLGFTDESIVSLVQGRANNVCKNLMLPLIYPESLNNPLEEMLKSRLKSSVNVDSRTNFFESNPTEYQKGALASDY